ncbi:hypothetical protein AAG906_021583 [Vitis piasezkii]
MDGQTEAVNRSLGDLLRCLVEENPKQWEGMVAQEEFAHNYSRNQTIGKNPFEVFYWKQPMHLYDLAPSLEMGTNSLKVYLDSSYNSFSVFITLKPHLKAIYKIDRYLKGTLGKELLFQKVRELKLEVDLVGSMTNKRLTTGYCTFLEGDLVT